MRLRTGVVPGAQHHHAEGVLRFGIVGVFPGIGTEIRARVVREPHLIHGQRLVVEYLGRRRVRAADQRKLPEGLLRLLPLNEDARLAHKGFRVGGIDPQGRVKLPFGALVIVVGVQRRARIGM